MPRGYVYRLFAAHLLLIAAPASALEQVTRVNGDVFIGSVVDENQRRVILKVERLIILARNASPATAGAEVRMLMHRDGSIFSGRFQRLAGGDFFLNETLYPANFEIPFSAIGSRQRLAALGTNTQGHVVSYQGKYLFYSEDGSYKEGIQPRDFTAPPVTKSVNADLSWLQLRLGFTATTTPIRSFLPGVWTGSVGYARETKSWLPLVSRWIPWLSAEAGWLYARQAPYSLSGIFGAVGPQWLLRWQTRHVAWAQLLMGANYLRVRDNFIDEAHISAAAFAHLGYGYRLGAYLVSAAAGLSYIHDSETPLAAIGFTLAVSRTMGDWN